MHERVELEQAGIECDRQNKEDDQQNCVVLQEISQPKALLSVKRVRWILACRSVSRRERDTKVLKDGLDA